MATEEAQGGAESPAQASTPAAPATKDTPTTELPAQPKSTGLSLLEVVIVSLAIVAACLFAYDRHYVQKIAVADLEGLQKDLEWGVTSGLITREQAMAELEKAIVTIAATPRRYAVILGSVSLGSKGRVKVIELTRPDALKNPGAHQVTQSQPFPTQKSLPMNVGVQNEMAR